jgi:mannose-6-phosphate isomerase
MDKAEAPVSGMLRARVAPRQIYSLIEGSRLGFEGKALELAHKGFCFYRGGFLDERGLAVNAVSIDGKTRDTAFDLYNQAFLLFALAKMTYALPERAPDLLARADRTLLELMATHAHPDGGFHQANPPKAPLCSNPHMHMLEACLAMEEAGGGMRWRELADEIAGLALARFIDPATGALHEFFELDWSRPDDVSKQAVEPGHQLEWAWLLLNWAGKRGKTAEILPVAARLVEIAETCGVDAVRGAAFMSLNADLSPRDTVARLWAQTEWLKAGIALAETQDGEKREAAMASILRAGKALEAYLDVPVRGLWRDKWRADGGFVDEPAPASSLYHIVCAISCLASFARQL